MKDWTAKRLLKAALVGMAAAVITSLNAYGNLILFDFSDPDIGLTVNQNTAGTWTVTDLGDLSGNSGLDSMDGIDMILDFTTGSGGTPVIQIPAVGTTDPRYFRLSNGRLAIQFVDAVSKRPVEIDFRLQFGGSMSANERNGFGTTDAVGMQQPFAGILTAPVSVPAGVVLTSDSVQNNNAATAQVGTIVWDGHGIGGFGEAETGGALGKLFLDPTTASIVPVPEPTTAIVLLGLISGAFFRRRRRMLA